MKEIASFTFIMGTGQEDRPDQEGDFYETQRNDERGLLKELTPAHFNWTVSNPQPYKGPGYHCGRDRVGMPEEELDESADGYEFFVLNKKFKAAKDGDDSVFAEHLQVIDTDKEKGGTETKLKFEVYLRDNRYNYPVLARVLDCMNTMLMKHEKEALACLLKAEVCEKLQDACNMNEEDTGEVPRGMPKKIEIKAASVFSTLSSLKWQAEQAEEYALLRQIREKENGDVEDYNDEEEEGEYDASDKVE